MTPDNWFTPYRRYWQDRFDMDLSAGGVLLIPNTNYLVAGGKEGILYLLDRNRMGGFDVRDPVVGVCPGYDDDPARDKVVQKFRASHNVYFEADPPGLAQTHLMCDIPFDTNAQPPFHFLHWPHIHGTPIFGKFKGGKAFLYVWPEKDSLKSFAWLGNAIQEKPRHATNARGEQILSPPFISFPRNGMPGGMLSLTIDPTSTDAGVLFASVQRCGSDTGAGHDAFVGVECTVKDCPVYLDPSFPRFHSNSFTTTAPCSSQMHGMLRAFDPITMVELWNDQSGTPASINLYMFEKYVPPTIAHGRVYLATDDGTVRVYGAPNLNGIWQSVDGTWQHLDDSSRVVSVAGSGGKLYQLQSDGSIWRYNGKDCRAFPLWVLWNEPNPDLSPLCPGWDQLDRNAKTVAITAGGGKLFQLHDDGEIDQFTGDICGPDGSCRGWFPLDKNLLTVAIAANDAALYQLHNDGSISRSTGDACKPDGSCPGWVPLDTNNKTIAIAAGGKELYQLHNDGSIFHSTGDVCKKDLTCPGWEQFDANHATAAITVGNGTLYQLHNDGSIFQSTGIRCANDHQCTGWLPPLGSDSAMLALTATGSDLYELRNNGAVAKHTGSTWTVLDTNVRTSSIVAADSKLYQVHAQPVYQLHQDGELWRYTGSSWEMLDRNQQTTSIAASGREVYELQKGGSIYRSTGLPCDGDQCHGWELLDRNATTIAIAAAGKELFQLHDSGEIWRYAGTAPCASDPCPGWQRIDNQKATAIVAAGRQLFQLRRDGSIWRYLGGAPCPNSACSGWEALDRNGATKSIAAAGTEFYQMHSDGGIFRYTGTPCDPSHCQGWEQLDKDSATVEIAAAGTQLVQRHANGDIWRYNGKPCDAAVCVGWEAIDKDSASAVITVSEREIYQMHSDGSIWRYTGAPCDSTNKCWGWELLDGNAATQAILAEGSTRKP